MDGNDFTFFIPICKSAEENEQRIVEGIASTEDLDFQNEIVVQKGLDYDYLVNNGFINWDHKPGPAYIIGEPLDARITPDGFHVRGKLYKGKPEADKVWELLKALEENRSSRRLGWSIQGKIDSRIANRVEKARVLHLALTHQPVNFNTFASIVKSFLATNEHEATQIEKAIDSSAVQPLMKENLDKRISSVLWGDCKSDCFDSQGKFREGAPGALHHLVVCKGFGVDESRDFLKKLRGSNIF